MSIDTIRYSIEKFVTSPYVVTGAGIAVFGVSCLPEVSIRFLSENVSIRTLQYYNISSFIINVIAVSVPGRLDGEDATTMTTTGTIPADCTTGNTSTSKDISDYNPNTSKTLLVPSGWAFIIWAPIYIGDLLFCTYGQFVLFNNNTTTTTTNSNSTAITNNKLLFSIITKSFVTACMYQSLWCASFRSNYFTKDNKWKRFISVLMLGSTAYSLYQLNTISSSSNTINTNNNSSSLFYNLSLLPLYLHSGWTTAATLVNLNGSIASLYNTNSTDKNNNTNHNTSDTIVIAVGHASVVVATIIGCYTCIIQKSTIFSITIAWALTACSTGIYSKQCKVLQQVQSQDKNQVKNKKNDDTIIDNADTMCNNSIYSQRIVRAMTIQQYLCQVGAIVCITSATVMNCFTF